MPRGADRELGAPPVGVLPGLWELTRAPKIMGNASRRLHCTEVRTSSRSTMMITPPQGIIRRDGALVGAGGGAVQP